MNGLTTHESFLLVAMANGDFTDPNRLWAKQLRKILAKVCPQHVPVQMGSMTRLTGNFDMLAGERIGDAASFRP